MKNIANCKPSEFLAQTYKIMNSAEEWLNVTQVLDMRRNMPTLEEIKEDATDEEKLATDERNRKAIREQLNKNIRETLDQIMNTNAEKTLELLALCCFVEPKDVDNYSVPQYLESLNELISNKKVLDFFTSLVRLVQMNF